MKHRKKWDENQKMEIIDHYKLHGAARTCREFEVGQASLYRWKAIYDEHGKAGFMKSEEKKASNVEIRQLKRENDALKKIVAEKELRIRVYEEMLKKNP